MIEFVLLQKMKNANYRCGLQPNTSQSAREGSELLLRGDPRTYEHASKVCRVSCFGDKLIHGVFGTERTVQLTRHGSQRAIRRLVRRPAAHI